MTPALIVGTVNGVLSLLDTLLPVYRDMVAKGEISVDQQTALLARIELYRSGAFFQQPHWQVAPDPTPPSPVVPTPAAPGAIPTVTAPVTVVAPPPDSGSPAEKLFGP